jgi:hypothetical protein
MGVILAWQGDLLLKRWGVLTNSPCIRLAPHELRFSQTRPPRAIMRVTDQACCRTCSFHSTFEMRSSRQQIPLPSMRYLTRQNRASDRRMLFQGNRTPPDGAKDHNSDGLRLTRAFPTSDSFQYCPCRCSAPAVIASWVGDWIDRRCTRDSPLLSMALGSLG